MTSQLHRRQVLLFLAAILLPCAALVFLGLRLVIQERELGAVRLGDERRRITRQLHQELVSRLERTALRQVTAQAVSPGLLQASEYGDSTVALVARASGGTIILPWEYDERPADAERLLREGAFAERVRQAERAEFAEAQPARAVDLYRAAGKAATDPVQVGSARLSLARALTKAGRQNEALAEHRKVVAASPEIVDEHGIPLSLYAASQLLKQGVADAPVWDCLGRALSRERWLPPPTLYLLRDLVRTYAERVSEDDSRRAAASFAQEITNELARTEQALVLKADFPSFGLIPVNAAPARQAGIWVPYGTPAWLVGAAPAVSGEQSVVVAVRLEPTLASLEAGLAASSEITGEIALARTTTDAEVEPLGSDLPGLVVRFQPAADATAGKAGNTRSWFYAAALCLVIGVTLFGAYLLWRDVRREVRLAEMRSSFVSAVSHELKTPLTAIRMFAETLRMNRPADARTREEYLDTIVNESERLTRLLNNVLDFSKIEQGTKSYRRAPHSLAEIVCFAARAMQYSLEQQRFVLQTEAEENMPAALVDRDAIEQAILNLLANAMKYSGDSRDIEMRLRSDDASAVIEVTDHGIGIEPREQSRIFERFYRVPGPETDRIPGTGLGLTLVQHIAEAHGGHVTVRSEPGKGSTFAIVLPTEEKGLGTRDQGPEGSR
jgi:signal transduction histidine kinase